jgi:hypothetical protein
MTPYDQRGVYAARNGGAYYRDGYPSTIYDLLSTKGDAVVRGVANVIGHASRR